MVHQKYPDQNICEVKKCAKLNTGISAAILNVLTKAKITLISLLASFLLWRIFLATCVYNLFCFVASFLLQDIRFMLINKLDQAGRDGSEFILMALFFSNIPLTFSYTCKLINTVLLK